MEKENCSCQILLTFFFVERNQIERLTLVIRVCLSHQLFIVYLAWISTQGMPLTFHFPLYKILFNLNFIY